MISTTKNHVILDKPSYTELRSKATHYQRLAAELRGRLRQRNALLNIALHELALAQGAKDPQDFERRWLREKRGGEPRNL